MKVFLYSLLLLLTCYVAKGQNAPTHSISGKVTDETGEPFPYATVTIDTLQIAASTDEEGRYLLTNIPPGIFQVTVQSFGFKKQTQTIEIKNKSVFNIDFRQYVEVITLDGVTLTSESETTTIENSAQAVSVIETTEARQKTGDLGEVLSQSEGVSVRRAGGLGSGMRFSLNGLTDDQIRFFVDDIPLEFSPYSLGLANIPVNLINRLEVYKGVLPVKFGADALGGGVNVVTYPIESGLGLDFSYSTKKKGMSSVEISKEFGINQKTAWAFHQKIQVAMESSGKLKLKGKVHVDEFTIGGPEKGKPGRSDSSKNKVMIAVEVLPKGQIGLAYAQCIEDYSKNSFSPFFEEKIEKKAKIVTDGFPTYTALKKDFRN